MKINVYYGGRGLLDDPTLYVLKKMEDVLRELRVNIERFNIYEHKNEIATLPLTFKEADGIILATTIEWLGIGGYMQQFLDACWLYGDKENQPYLYAADCYVHNLWRARGRTDSDECMGDSGWITMCRVMRICRGSGGIQAE